MKKYLTKKHIIVFSLVLLLMIIGLFFYKPEKINANDSANETISLVSEKNEETESFYVDVKGAVKKPGVYLFDNTQVINDAINTAGGLSKNATTKNINLSKSLKKEMVIYVFTTSELTKLKKVNNVESCPEVVCKEISCPELVCPDIPCPEIKCPVIECNCNNSSNTDNSNQDSPSSSTKQSDNEADQPNSNSKININTSNLELLMTLPGIGESKAKAIIEYRNKNNFTIIEDIKNVSGIGESIFNKLKDLIEV